MRLKSGADVKLPSLAVECDLCSKWVMESPTSFLFELRPNARWQNLAPVNGRTVNADDLVFSLHRQADADSPNSPLLHNVAGVEAAGATSLRVNLASSDADALLALADGHSKIVAREAVDHFGHLRDGPTIGTGPWILEQSTPDDAHAFSRNVDYFEPGLPLVDELRILILTDVETRNAAFQTGLVDIVSMGPAAWTDYVEDVPSAPSIQIPQPGIGLEVAFNTTVAPFDDVRVRRAALMAMDPINAIERHWAGYATIGPPFPVASREWIIPSAGLANRFNRPDEAIRLVRGARDDIPIPVTVSVGNFGPSYIDHANTIAAELRGVGFEPLLEINDRRDYGERIWLGGEFEMMVGPAAPITVPNGYLLPVLHSDGAWNTTGHKDNALDELLESQAVETDPARRAELILQIQERVLDQSYRVMPAVRIEIWTWTRRVRDFHPNFAASDYFHWSRVWVDK